jgi:hypothetical protein
MHGECARRAGYYLETGKVDNGCNSNDDNDNDNQSQSNKVLKSAKSKPKIPNISQRDKSLFKIFCEGHRPFKLIKQIKEKHDSNSQELEKFCKIMKRALDTISRIPYKFKAIIEKKWKEKDKKTLLDRVRDRFFQLKKLRINVIKIDPSKKRKRRSANHNKFKLKTKRQKITDFSEAKLGGDQASVDNESSIISSIAHSKVEEPKEIMYKIANPCFPAEPDWSITLSRNDFPWYDIKFDDYSAQECFDMYRSIITDEEMFNK